MLNYDFGTPPITKEAFDSHRTDGKTRRIHFGTSHAEQPRRRSGSSAIGIMSLPFGDSIKDIFEADTKLRLSAGKFGFYRFLNSEAEFQIAAEWVSAQGTRVFLRTLLPISIALDLYKWTPTGNLTQTAILVDAAKNQSCTKSAQTLAGLCETTIEQIPFFAKADYICAVPPSPGKSFDLPSYIAKTLSSALGKYDLTPHFSFKQAKKQNKQSVVEQKWLNLSAAGLAFERLDLREKTILLIDDNYQSGTTLHYVAKLLLEAGAEHVYSLCLTKTLSDSDNV